MEMIIVEVGSFALTSNAFNLASDLKQNSVYVTNIIKSSYESLANLYSSEGRYLLSLSDEDYVRFSTENKKFFSEKWGYYLIDGSFVFITSPANHLSVFNRINRFKNYGKLSVYKLFNVSPLKVRLFFKAKNVPFNVYSDGLDVKVVFNITALGVEAKWNFLKEFVLQFNDYIYAETDVSLPVQLIKILKMRGLKMSTAESFTAGGIASYITSVSGASEVFYEGVVAYDEGAKQKRLGVLDNTLKIKRPVSSETAYEMAKGALHSGVDATVATTGLAGPNSDGSGLPVGLVFIAVGTEEKISVYKYNFSGSRKDVTNRAIETAVFLLIKALRDGSFNV